MRIGILIRDFKTLDNWELRVLDKIKNTPSLELVLLIKDGRKERDENNSKGFCLQLVNFQSVLKLGYFI